MIKQNIGFIGGGNMAQALISGLIRKKISPTLIFVSDPDTSKLVALRKKFRIKTFKNNSQIAKTCSILILATKPSEIKTVLREISPLLQRQLILSIAAGIDTETLRHLIPKKSALLRAMPNNPALIGQGITGLYAAGRLRASQKKTAEEIFAGSGKILWVQEEGLLDAVTGLSGSGPAYVYRFVWALAKAGAKAGLPYRHAYALALQTLIGSALTLEQRGETPSELIGQVTSQKGTTLAALEVLDKHHFDRILEKTVLAATQRAREIRDESKK